MFDCVNTLPSLVISDLDGTLLDDQDRISIRTRKALNTVIKSGVPVILATGRPPRDLSCILSQLDFTPWCVCTNGAAYFDSSTKTLEVNTYLSAYDIHYCISVFKSAVPTIGFAVEPLGLKTDFLCDDHYIHPWRDPERNIVSLSYLAHEDAFKMLISAPNLSSLELCTELRPLIEGKFALSYSTSQGLVELSPLGVNKAVAVQALAERLAYSTDRALAFGDMENDRELLLWAWRGVVMGNADIAIRGITPWSTGSNMDEGVAMVIENLWRDYMI